MGACIYASLLLLVIDQPATILQTVLSKYIHLSQSTGLQEVITLYELAPEGITRTRQQPSPHRPYRTVPPPDSVHTPPSSSWA
jgi:hypothetical protein